MDTGPASITAVSGWREVRVDLGIRNILSLHTQKEWIAQPVTILADDFFQVDKLLTIKHLKYLSFSPVHPLPTYSVKDKYTV